MTNRCANWTGSKCCLPNDLSPCSHHGEDYRCKIRGDLTDQRKWKTKNELMDAEFKIPDPFFRNI